MSGKKTFIDSNIWLYAFVDDGSDKHQIACETVAKTEFTVISTQVISEVCVNLIKKAKSKETFIQELITDFCSNYEVMFHDELILLKASELRSQYSLSYWDSLICAAALAAQCKILLTEDIHNGLIVDNRLRIINPMTTPEPTKGKYW